tara:strand:- start:308 stop:760 length:453 start_codon:yes stop_codon:yes gene_type:complete
MAAVGGYIHPTDTTTIAMSNIARPTTCYIQKNGCLNTNQTFGNWYWLNRTPMIRLNFLGSSSSIEENMDSNLELYPNPVKDKLTFVLNNKFVGYCNIEFFDVFGKEIFSKEIDVAKNVYHTIDISDFKQGVYILNIRSSDGFVNRKFFKQ